MKPQPSAGAPRLAAALRAPPSQALPWWPTALSALAVLAGLLLGLALFAPAQWLAQAASSASAGRISLPNAQGSVWNGRADLLLSAGAGSRDRAALAQGLQWRLRPHWQGGPALAWQISAPCCTPQPLAGVLSLGWQRATLQLDAHQSAWPAELLSGLGSPWNSLQLQGQIGLRSEGLRLHLQRGRAQLHGSLVLQAHGLATALSTLRPLGSYQLQIEGAPLAASSGPEQPTQIDLSTLLGPFQLSGQGQIVGGRLHFRGLAESDEAHLGALSNLLNMLGQRDGRLRAHLRIG
ncbi:MAG: type II secretion system protein N [Serpentinimonas sp.]|nr:type II secretion system protein N [Serpentinimonas sp.]